MMNFEEIPITTEPVNPVDPPKIGPPARYDVVEHLRTPEEMAAYLEACFEEANGDATFIA